MATVFQCFTCYHWNLELFGYKMYATCIYRYQTIRNLEEKLCHQSHIVSVQQEFNPLIILCLALAITNGEKKASAPIKEFFLYVFGRIKKGWRRSIR